MELSTELSKTTALFIDHTFKRLYIIYLFHKCKKVFFSDVHDFLPNISLFLRNISISGNWYEKKRADNIESKMTPLREEEGQDRILKSMSGLFCVFSVCKFSRSFVFYCLKTVYEDRSVPAPFSHNIALSLPLQLK